MRLRRSDNMIGNSSIILLSINEYHRYTHRSNRSL